MTDSFIQVPPNSSGEKVRVFRNLVGADNVDSEAVTVTDKAGNVMKDIGANGRIFVDASEVAVPVTDNGGSLTVDGTVTANAGTGPWPVTDNGGSLTVDGSVTAIAQPGVDIGDVTINNAAGASAVNIQDGGNSITVDGTFFQATQPVSGTITASEAKAEDSVAASADSGIPILAVRNDAAASKTSADGDYSMLATDAAGRVGIADLGGSISVDDNAGSLTVDAPVATPVFVRLSDGAAAITALPVTDNGGSLTVDGTVAATQSGTWTVGLTNDSTKLEDAAAASGDRGMYMLGVRNDTNTVTTSADGDYSQLSTDSAGRLKVTLRSAFAEDTASVDGDIGDFMLGVRNDTSAVKTSADGDYSQISTDSAGRLKVVSEPSGTNGYTISKLISAATTNATSVKASAGQLYGYFIYNDANATRYVKLHNTAGAPTAGTGVVMTIGIPAGSAANVEFINGIAFGTGIAFTTVTGIADANATAVGASDLAINLFYK